MAKQIPTRPVAKSEYKNYRDKGVQFFHVMQICLEDGEWDAALLNGVHACISFNDAITTWHLGKTSSGKSHQDSIHLLSQAISSADGKRNSTRLAEIINFKNLVEYEPRRFTETDARNFEKKVERFVEWVRTQLPSL